MSSQNTIQIIIVIAFLLCGYIALCRSIAERAPNRATLTAIFVVLLMIYAGITVPLVLIVINSGNMLSVLITILMLLACVTAILSIYLLIKNYRIINKSALLMFVLVLFVVGYITLFSRDGTNDTSIRVQFAAIQEAIRTRSFEPLQHLWLNIVMFIPIGFLLPCVYPPRLNNYSLVFMVGLMCSCFIESMQMILTFGQPDVEDLLGNTVGALIGIMLYRILLRRRGAKKR